MSCIEIYKITVGGVVQRYNTVNNPHACAMHIWDTLSFKYMRNHEPPKTRDEQSGGAWPLFMTDRMALRDSIVMGFTFDRVWVKKENLPRVIAALGSFWEDHHVAKPSHGAGAPFNVAPTIPGVIAVLSNLLTLDVRGACFNQTSVNSNPWALRGEPDPETGGEADYRPFDFKTDTHIHGKPVWELFDESAWGREAET